MDLFSLWDQILKYINQNDHEYYQMFYSNVFPISLSDTTLVISPSKPLLVGWIQNVYKKKLEQIITQITGKHLSLKIVSPGEEAPEAAPFPMPSPAPMPEDSQPAPVMPAPAPVPAEEAPSPEAAPKAREADPFPEEVKPPDFTNLQPKTADEVTLPNILNYNGITEGSLFDNMPKGEANPKSFQPNPINEEYTFETFVHGNCNEMAYQAAYSVAHAAADPDKTMKDRMEAQNMNPLFIYGPSGLGKTHLLHAICNYVHAYKPELSVLFVSSETFTNELIDAIQKQAMPKFREKYRTLDFLLIDDVQFFGSRDSTKMEIFNIFNELFDKKKQIIMTSDRTPSDIEKLEDRLQTRFSSGLVVPISPPDYEICCIILKKRAEKKGFHLPQDVVDYIASHINTNVRELEGAFNRVYNFSRIKKVPITLPFVKEALQDMIPIDNGDQITVDSIIDTVCKYYGVKKEQLLGNGRPKKIVIPRQIAMYLCRNELHESYPTLRDCFKRKDHSTVLYACERVQKDIDRDPQTRAAIEAIRKMIHS